MNERLLNEELKQLREVLNGAAAQEGDIIPLLREAVKNWEPNHFFEEEGQVLTVGDGVATVKGLPNAQYGEILLFEDSVSGMVQDLRRDELGCILFGGTEGICAGSAVHRTGKTAGIPVGEAFLGRVVNALGAPIDGKGPILSSGYSPIEIPAPGIVERCPVTKPLQTGILTIDSMFPIGRGQRELIIGDRQTGKTAIALDAIINQRGKDVLCIYVAIGQKNSSVAQVVEKLRIHDALDYTVVVHAGAGEPSPMQYVAPYAGCALGEYFMHRGRDVLIVYDDLSKHAVAYRTMSLILGRSPGREAYPGDVFYLHSRLLERSASLSDSLGGGSMTALPIVETQAGDVSAYIPTNIISITDGQIYLESDLFFAGQRPAVNVGLSVSRVGGDAQTRAMKKATGTLRLDLAQYREMEVFTQFSSDLDSETERQLRYGKSLMTLLRQEQYKPLSQAEEVALLLCSMAHLFEDFSAENIPAAREAVLEGLHSEQESLMRSIEETGSYSDSDRESIIAAAQAILKGRQ